MGKKQKKTFDYLNFAYGLGAAIVITGAMFKFLGWDYANEMFLVGLTTEAVIFIISGIDFKVESRRLRWERVFPQIDPAYKGEAPKIDLNEAQDLYYRNTETLVNSVSSFNESIKRLNEATEKLALGVEKIGTSIDRIDKSTSSYESELEELKSRMKRVNHFYDEMGLIAGEKRDKNSSEEK